MNEKGIFLFAREIGCCEGCSVRCLGVKNPNVYGKLSEYVKTFYDETVPVQSSIKPDVSKGDDTLTEIKSEEMSNSEIKTEDIELKTISKEFLDKTVNKRHIDSREPTNETSCLDSGPPVKRRKWPVCVCCLGIMQEETWSQCYDQVQEVLEKKMYESPTFACALSAPISTILREKAISMFLKEKFPDFEPRTITPLKEAWKWCFGGQLEKQIHKVLDSGSISPLLIQLNFDYAHEIEELEVVKKLSPGFFKERSYRGKHRFPVEFTKRSVEQALESIKTTEMKTEWQTLSVVNQSITCVSVMCTHVPIYLGGRYVKLSRELCQTPWILNGKRLMESSVQDIIFDEIAKVLHIKSEDIEHRLKFLSAGREDVDVRCLGNGRPFAVEVSDPRRFPTAGELQSICEAINDDKRIMVKRLSLVSREDLTILKQGEETKNKTYEALCIKLGDIKHSTETKQNGCHTIEVTQTDIDKINSFTNLSPGEGGKWSIVQRTPIRVLHRRPLLERTRMILELEAKLVPEHPRLFTIRVKTSAGTYVKEWVHGDLGRAKPCLGDAIGAPVDILALDVKEVHLDWPPVKK